MSAATEAAVEPSFLLMCAWQGQSQLVSVRAGSIEEAIAKTKTWADPPKRAYHYPMPPDDPIPPASIAATALRTYETAQDAVAKLHLESLRALHASVELGDGLDQLARSIDVVVTERDALRAVLTDILKAFSNTYDASQGSAGLWTDAASIPNAVMERAAKLVGAK